MMNNETLNKSKPDRDALIKDIQAFLETRADIRFAYVFGSFLDEEYFRDIDLGIFIDEIDAITKDKFYDIELSTKIEEIVKFPVDIIVLNRAPAAIVYNASKGMLIKNTDDDLRVDFITLSWNKYWDYKHILHDHMEERKRENVGVNKERIISLIGDIEKSLQLLKEFSRKGKDELLGDMKSLGSVKYYFMTAIAACCDICNHITSKERWGVPDSYAGCFSLLKDHGIISDDFAKKLVNMAKFRNLLVHFYRKIDDEKVYEFLQTELDVFQTYIDVIAKQYL